MLKQPPQRSHLATNIQSATLSNPMNFSTQTGTAACDSMLPGAVPQHAEAPGLYLRVQLQAGVTAFFYCSNHHHTHQTESFDMNPALPTRTCNSQHQAALLTLYLCPSLSDEIADEVREISFPAVIRNCGRWCDADHMSPPPECRENCGTVTWSFNSVATFSNISSDAARIFFVTGNRQVPAHGN